jgi:serpin B
VASDALKKMGGDVSTGINALVDGNNRFALDLYGRLRAEPGNLFFSPGSISIALAMTYAGASADTATQMAEVLHFDLASDRLHPAFAELADQLRVKKDGIQVRVANRLWGQQGYDFLPAFLSLTKEQYRAELGLVDFEQHAEQAR